MDASRHHLKLLGALEALLSEGSVTAAARRLHLSQPATSALLAQLRRQFNDPLLVRAGRRLVLTPRAVALQPLLTEALVAVDRLFGEASDFDPGRLVRRFRLAVSDPVGQLLMPALLSRVVTEAPGVTLQIVASGHEVPMQALAGGTLDLAIAHFESIAPDLRGSALYERPLVAVCRRQHPRIHGRLSVRQFVASQHVSIIPHAFALEEALRRTFIEAGRPYRLLASLQPIGAALAIVAATDALALVTEPIARRHADALALQVLKLPPALDLPPVVVRALWQDRKSVV